MIILFMCIDIAIVVRSCRRLKFTFKLKPFRNGSHMLIPGPIDRFHMQSLPKIRAASNGSHAPFASETEEPPVKRARQPKHPRTHIPCLAAAHPGARGEPVPGQRTNGPPTCIRRPAAGSLNHQPHAEQFRKQISG